MPIALRIKLNPSPWPMGPPPASSSLSVPLLLHARTVPVILASCLPSGVQANCLESPHQLSVLRQRTCLDHLV